MGKKKRKRAKKGPMPRQHTVSRPKMTPQRIFLIVIGALMILSMTLGLVFAALAKGGGF